MFWLQNGRIARDPSWAKYRGTTRIMPRIAVITAAKRFMTDFLYVNRAIIYRQVTFCLLINIAFYISFNFFCHFTQPKYCKNIQCREHNATNWVFPFLNRVQLISFLILVRLDLASYWLSVSHHNHYTKEPTVNGNTGKLSTAFSHASLVLVWFN